ncbi:MAG: hypothetical protein II290_08750 [Oscillospiraceae bacterium]|nr:hypothetical protein [Oscillospiraceae bacterium]
MKKIELYRYEGDGRVTITPTPRDASDIPSQYRMIADEGLELTDGVTVAECIDVPCDAVGAWREVEKEISAEEALEIIMGGVVDA